VVSKGGGGGRRPTPGDMETKGHPHPAHRRCISAALSPAWEKSLSVAGAPETIVPIDFRHIVEDEGLDDAGRATNLEGSYEQQRKPFPRNLFRAADRGLFRGGADRRGLVGQGLV